MIKLSVNETKCSCLLARPRALILYFSIWIFDFGPVKLPKLSRNGPLLYSAIRHFNIDHNARCLLLPASPPPKKIIIIKWCVHFCSFSWVLREIEDNKTMDLQHFGCKQAALWSMWNGELGTLIKIDDDCNEIMNNWLSKKVIYTGEQHIEGFWWLQ